jgi:hypothetical protein
MGCRKKIHTTGKEMSVAEVRTMLGDAAHKYSDDEIKKIIDMLFGLAYITYEIYRKDSQNKR